MLLTVCCVLCSVFFFKQKTAYEMRISDWSSDVCSSDLLQQRPTAAFRVVAILLTLWNAFGCYAWYLQWTLGADAMGPATQYDRQLYAALPGWYNGVYAIAVGAGLLGSFAMQIGRAHV